MGEAVSSCVMARSRRPGGRKDRRGPVGRSAAFWSRTGCGDVTRTARSAPVGPAGRPGTLGRSCTRPYPTPPGWRRRRPGAARSRSSPTPTRARRPSPRSSCSTAARSTAEAGAVKARERPALGHVGLDGARAAARHLDHLDRAAVPVPRLRRQPARHARPPRLLRGHLPGAGRRRRRGHGARRGQGHRAPDAQAVRGVPGARPAAAHLHQQVGPARAATRSSCSTRSRRRSASRPRRSPGRSASPATSAGVIDRRDGEFIRFTRIARGATEAPEEIVDAERAAAEEGDGLDAARPRSSSCSTASAPSSTTKLFLGRRDDAGVLRLGAHQLRRPAAARRRHRPRPVARRPRRDVDGKPRAARRAVLRASCSRSRRTWTRRTATASPSCGCARAGSSAGMVVTHGRPASRSPPSTPTRCSARSARRSRRPSPATSSAWSTPPTCGSATRSTSTSPSRSRRIPSFAPEHFSVARVRDTGRFKQFRGASPSSTRRAWCRCCATPTSATRPRCSPPSARCSSRWRVHRLENEFGAPVELSPTGVHASPAAPTRRSADALRSHAGRRRARAGRRHAARAVREPLLARAARRRAARAHPRAAGRRRARRLIRRGSGSRRPAGRRSTR